MDFKLGLEADNKEEKDILMLTKINNCRETDTPEKFEL
jgi:hypothetical protein